MEALLALVGLIGGWILSQLGLSLQSVREQRGRERADRRQLYARLLAASDACYRTIDLIVNWKTQTASLSPTSATGRRRDGSSGSNALTETMTELEHQLRASRQLFAEVRLIASEEVIEVAGQLHRGAEDGMLLVRFSSGETTTRNRWTALDGVWVAARQRFEKIARDDLGTTLISPRSRWRLPFSR